MTLSEFGHKAASVNHETHVTPLAYRTLRIPRLDRKGQFASVDLDQFAECDITMRDLTIIKEAIVSCLTGVYHSRVQYPKLKLKRKESEEEKATGDKK